MKRPKKAEEDTKSKTVNKSIRRPNPNHTHRSQQQDHVTEMLKLCLERVCELQANLDRNDDVHDPEAAGYAACAMETLRFLSSQGLSSDHPIVKGLTEKLLQNRDNN